MNSRVDLPSHPEGSVEMIPRESYSLYDSEIALSPRKFLQLRGCDHLRYDSTVLKYLSRRT